MRVVIVGEGKSGTTALMRSVADSLDSPVELFEPRSITPDDIAPESLVIKKLLMNWQRSETELLPNFDKRLLITRDPRDRLISHMLYDAYNRAPMMSERRRRRWLRTLKRKVEHPRKVPMAELIHVWWRVSKADLLSTHVRVLDRGVAFHNHRAITSFHVVKYEDYVVGNFDALNDYLGFTIEPGVVKDSEQRVSRTKSSGAWRHWFTPSDVKLFRPMTHRWLKETGGDSKDWKLAKNPTIDPATSIDYVSSFFDQVSAKDS